MQLNIDGLALVQSTRYLGVCIDSCLEWKEHIISVSNKVSRALGILKHAKSFLPLESLKTLYLGVVEPHFRYCCSDCGCCGSTGINHLQKLQNRAARIVFSSSIDAPSRPPINELGWKTIVELIESESKVMVYKSQHQLAPQYLSSMFTKNSNLCSRNLRNSETDSRLPIKKSANGQKCFLEEKNFGIASQLEKTDSHLTCISLLPL